MPTLLYMTYNAETSLLCFRELRCHLWCGMWSEDFMREKGEMPHRHTVALIRPLP